MSKCPNCGAAMSCGCQKRVSKDGKVGCSNCIGGLNARTASQPVPKPNKNMTPTIQKAVLHK